MKQKQQQMIKDWAEKMVEKYDWLTIKYEYSDFYRTVLVSFSPSEVIDNDDDFNRDALAFEDLMTAEFGDNAPLFTDEEELFIVSTEATVVAKNVTSSTRLVIDSSFSLLSGILPNWMSSSSYNQVETFEKEMAVDSCSEPVFQEAA